MFRTAKLAAFLLVAFASTASAQLFSTASTAAMNAKKAETIALGVDLTGLSGQTAATAQTIAEGTTTSFGSITLTPTWDLAEGRNVQVVAWISSEFTDAAGNKLPNSYLEGQGGDVASYAAFTGSSTAMGATNSALLLQSTAATLANRKVTGTTKQFSLALRMVVPAAATVVPGTYGGVLTLRAVAQ